MKKAAVSLFAACAVLLLFSGCFVGQAQAASGKKLKKYDDIMAYVKKNKPASLTLKDVTLSPVQLQKISKAMPKGSKLSFTTTWEGCTFSDTDKRVELKKIRKTPTAEEIRAILSICPKCTYINLYTGRAPSNEVMGALADQYPKVRFNWPIRLGGKYTLSSVATTFSTFIATLKDPRLEDADVKNLKYCKYMRALDLGHNHISSEALAGFLPSMPNLELLIISSTHVIDLTPLSQLKHLKYLEVYATKANDLRPLAACKELIDLNIDNARLTNLKGLEKLDKLERLWILHCKDVSRAEVNRFRKQHPNCVINYPGLTKGVKKWRNHPRFFHFRWCLKNEKWIPFDQPLPTEKKSMTQPAPAVRFRRAVG